MSDREQDATKEREVAVSKERDSRCFLVLRDGAWEVLYKGKVFAWADTLEAAWKRQGLAREAA